MLETFAENASQTITYPSPCFIVRTWYLQSYLIPGHHTYCLPSLPKRLNFDLSKKSTFNHFLPDQSLCNNTNSRWAVLFNFWTNERFFLQQLYQRVLHHVDALKLSHGWHQQDFLPITLAVLHWVSSWFHFY